jgi:hypothetical protein
VSFFLGEDHILIGLPFLKRGLWFQNNLNIYFSISGNSSDTAKRSTAGVAIPRNRASSAPKKDLEEGYQAPLNLTDRTEINRLLPCEYCIRYEQHIKGEISGRWQNIKIKTNSEPKQHFPWPQHICQTDIKKICFYTFFWHFVSCLQ